MIQKQFNFIRIIFISCAIVFLIAGKYFTNNMFLMICLALLFSGTIGLAHGSLDWSLAKLLGLRTNRRENINFVIAYLLCIGVTLTVWHYIPSLALIIFLLMSVVHFAGDWRQELSPIHAYILGMAMICLPTVSFYSEVKSIFELLLAGSDATLLTDIMYYLAIITSVMLSTNLICLLGSRKQLWLVIEVFFLMLLGILLTPIVYFSIYFCFLHAPKHWIRMRETGLYTRLSQGIHSVLWPTFACVLCGAVVIYYSPGTMSYTDTLCKTVFIGLAALTVPHWILVEIYGNNNACKRRSFEHL